MIERQVLSKILTERDFSIIEENLLDKSFFPSLQDEFEFIRSHVDEYGVVPDIATFLAKFSDFDIVDVLEPNEYLVSALREEDLYRRSVPVVYKIRDLLQTDANMAAEYMIGATKELQPTYHIKGTDIIAKASERYTEFTQRGAKEDWYFETGFQELDDVIHGIQRGEEFCVLFARLGNGKSWILEKISSHIWGLGFNVGFISPEMSAISAGFRFDTLQSNFSNRGLMTGKDDSGKYKDYTESLKQHKNKFIVSTIGDFGKSVTVSKVRNWIKQYKLDFVAIDGIKYLEDERARRSDGDQVRLTHISEDLMELSIELKVPIVVVVQANREGVVDPNSDALPEIENIRDSDGIAHNATKIIALRQKDNELLMKVEKNRFGKVGVKLHYLWDIDTGNFNFVPSEDSPRQRKERTESSYKDSKNVF